MINYKVLNKNALLKNINYCQSFGKNIMVMVKAEAYGHKLKHIVKMLSDSVDFFGVANEQEALRVRRYLNDKQVVLVVGKSVKYKQLILNGVHITIDCLEELYNINAICKKVKKCANIHIAINTGMNRIGVKDIKEFKAILDFIRNSNCIKLKGIFTHMFDADEKCTHIYSQLNKFKKYVSIVKNICEFIHIGGSFCLNYKLPKYINMVRVGLFAYGYGNINLCPIMELQSKIAKITQVKLGEYIGYGHIKAKKDTLIAQVPLGYADGIPRNLSNRLYVKIFGKRCRVVGKICMDCLFVDITNIKAKVKDDVIIFDDANYYAKLLKMSPYEVLTNFVGTRAKVKIE